MIHLQVQTAGAKSHGQNWSKTRGWRRSEMPPRSCAQQDLKLTGTETDGWMHWASVDRPKTSDAMHSRELAYHRPVEPGWFYEATSCLRLLYPSNGQSCLGACVQSAHQRECANLLSQLRKPYTSGVRIPKICPSTAPDFLVWAKQIGGSFALSRVSRSSAVRITPFLMPISPSIPFQYILRIKAHARAHTTPSKYQPGPRMTTSSGVEVESFSNAHQTP